MQEIKLNGESMNIVEDNIEKLKTIFPDVFTERKVDFEKLQGVLGNYIETNDERYNFTWAGKQNALRLAQTPSTGTLRPCKEESKNWDTTQNLYIEGDNLEVLKLLQKSYHNKIKMIYIDPPYNTGNDFVYKDDFKDNIENYKKITGQVDEEGNKISSNSESDGRYHTNWLNMMYPRLRLARNLLKEDGVIFISIDDKEEDNLKKLCNEVFGEENFIAQIIHKNNSMKNQTKLMGVTTEYMFIYAKSKTCLKETIWRVIKKGANDVESKFKELKQKGYKLKDIENEIKEMYFRPKYSHLSRWNKVDEKGVFMDSDLSRSNGYKNFTIINPNTNEECIIPSRGWGKTKEELLRLQREDLIWYGDGTNPPRMKSYMSIGDTSVPDNFWYFDNSIDTRWIKEIFGEVIFDNPKPLEMIKQAISLHTNNNDIILDFFSGSATTAHAVIQLNSEDNSNRKFICVQLPEQTDEKSEAYKAGYKNICEIGKERIRRAGEKIKQEIEQENQQLKLGEEPKKVPDIGFKVFKLDSSNIKKWNANTENIEKEMQSSIFNYVEGRSELDITYEVMLKCGLDLTYPIEEIKVEDKTLYSVGAGAMFICMDDRITQSIADKIIAIKEENEIEEPVVVFKDNGFIDDSTKTNIKESLRVAGIKDFITV